MHVHQSSRRRIFFCQMFDTNSFSYWISFWSLLLIYFVYLIFFILFGLVSSDADWCFLPIWLLSPSYTNHNLLLHNVSISFYIILHLYYIFIYVFWWSFNNDRNINRSIVFLLKNLIFWTGSLCFYRPISVYCTFPLNRPLLNWHPIFL